MQIRAMQVIRWMSRYLPARSARGDVCKTQPQQNIQCTCACGHDSPTPAADGIIIRHSVFTV